MSIRSSGRWAWTARCSSDNLRTARPQRLCGPTAWGHPQLATQQVPSSSCRQRARSGCVVLLLGDIRSWPRSRCQAALVGSAPAAATRSHCLGTSAVCHTARDAHMLRVQGIAPLRRPPCHHDSWSCALVQSTLVEAAKQRHPSWWPLPTPFIAQGSVHAYTQPCLLRPFFESALFDPTVFLSQPCLIRRPLLPVPST